MQSIAGNPGLQNATVWIYGVNQTVKMRKLYRAMVVMGLEVLGNARVSLLRENRGVLDPRVPTR